MNTKRTVEHNGTTYKVKSDSVIIPDFSIMSNLEVLVWLNRETYAQGRSTVKPNPLAGYGGVVIVRSGIGHG